MADDPKPRSAAKQDEPVLDADKVQEVGYFGTRNPRHPDAAYSLQTGPDSPSGENGPE
jgi:hypothetical protein